MSEIKRKDRPGDQPPPVPNDGPSMHDLVCDDLVALWPPRAVEGVVRDLQARKKLGLERYGSFLQPYNDRDVLRDLNEELLDAAAYAKQAVEESGSSDRVAIYHELLPLLILVRRMRDEHS